MTVLFRSVNKHCHPPLPIRESAHLSCHPPTHPSVHPATHPSPTHTYTHSFTHRPSHPPVPSPTHAPTQPLNPHPPPTPAPPHLPTHAPVRLSPPIPSPTAHSGTRSPIPPPTHLRIPHLHPPITRHSSTSPIPRLTLQRSQRLPRVFITNMNQDKLSSAPGRHRQDMNIKAMRSRHERKHIPSVMGDFFVLG